MVHTYVLFAETKTHYLQNLRVYLLLQSLNVFDRGAFSHNKIIWSIWVLRNRICSHLPVSHIKSISSRNDTFGATAAADLVRKPPGLNILSRGSVTWASKCRARVFHIPWKDQSSPARRPAEIDPLIFYATANDKGPFPKRNECAPPPPLFPESENDWYDIHFVHSRLIVRIPLNLSLFLFLLPRVLSWSSSDVTRKR